jgi:hypothetical protein
MKEEATERWYQLCVLAAAENDPAKLLAMVTEINRLLTEKEQSLPERSRDAMRNKWRDIAREVDRELDVEKMLNQAPLEEERQKALRNPGPTASAG